MRAAASLCFTHRHVKDGNGEICSRDYQKCSAPGLEAHAILADLCTPTAKLCSLVHFLFCLSTNLILSFAICERRMWKFG
uniref:Secreted protein n=1 Tax=Echinococcus granulosus TaxID=6210 RepID=A0A068WYI6_ECHGR|nr:hypothetical protein EgrG_002011400 [Echinococcus granulosus]